MRSMTVNIGDNVRMQNHAINVWRTIMDSKANGQLRAPPFDESLVSDLEAVAAKIIALSQFNDRISPTWAWIASNICQDVMESLRGIAIGPTGSSN